MKGKLGLIDVLFIEPKNATTNVCALSAGSLMREDAWKSALKVKTELRGWSSNLSLPVDKGKGRVEGA